jgi:PAS domain S-box-containing protein
MQARPESPAEEITRLHGCLDDLNRMVALPPISTGGEASRMITLLDMLVGTLRFSFVFVRLNDPQGGPPTEITRVAKPLEGSSFAREISEALREMLGVHPRKQPTSARVSIGNVELCISCAGLGIQGELGVVVAGSQKVDFPEQTESLLLAVAANQTTIALQQARLLISQRTRELAIAKDEPERRERDSWRVIDSIPGPIALLKKEGDVDIVNRHLLEYFGTTVEKAMQWGTNDLVHPEDLPHVLDGFARSVESGIPYENEYRLRRWDGVYRWFQGRALPLRDASGQIFRWCVLLTDIDDRKRAEDAIRANERNLKLIIDTIPAVAWSARADGSADFFSQHYLDYVGLPLEQLKDWGWTAAVHPDDLNGLAAVWQRVMASEQAGEAEVRLRRFDGSYRWFLFRASPLRDESGKVVKWYGANLDIEDRKRGEDAQRARELSWRQIVDNIPGFVVTMAPGGEVEFLNRQTLEYFGKTDDDLRNWSLIGAVHPDDLPRIVEARTKAVETGHIYHVEHRCRRADGIYRWFQVRGLPVRNAEGAITGWYLLLTDIDDRKKAEEALQASERNLSQMINAIRTFVLVLRPDGSVLDVNQTVLDYTGVTLAEMQKEDYRTRFFHPEDVGRLREERRAALTRAVPFENEQRCLGKDGRYRWFLARYNPVLDERGEIDRWYVAAFDIDDRKSAEAELKRAYLQLTEAQRLSKTGSFITDLVADDHNWSEEAHRIFEFDPATKVTLQMIRERIHPEDLPSVDADIARAISGSDVENLYRIVTSLGVVKHVRGTGQVIERIEGRPIFCGALQDVTESKLAEEALRASERNLNQIINAIPAVIGVIRADGSPLYANQAGTDYTGLTAEDMVKEDFRARLFHPEDLEKLREARRQAFTRAVPFENEIRSLGKDGRYRWFLFRYKPQLDEAGKIDRWYMTAFDIEDRKRAEEELRRAYNSFADAQRLSKTGSFITDLVGDDHNWSEEAYRIFEFDPATKVTLARIRNAIHSDDLVTFEAMIARAMTGVHVNFAFRIVTAKGAVKHVHGVAHVIEQVEGRPMFVGALQDVTERKLAEEALERARSELGHVARVSTLNTLTASIAHEINQPLSGIITNASTCLRMLDGSPPNIDGARETVRRSLRDGNRASDVIKRLRALYSRKEFTLEPLDLNEAAREVIALCLSDLQRNQILLRPELSEDLPLVTGDRVQLQQVILNLLRNASDAMSTVDDRPRELLVRTEPDEGDQVRLIVKDVGLGFTPEAAAKLFQAFYTTKNDGMGIGLSVSLSIIERHHGRLWAEPNDGPGATFLFSIPSGPGGGAGAAPSIV